MQDRTSLQCPKCKEGILDFVWVTEQYNHDWGTDWESYAIMEAKSCECEFTEKEEDDLGEKSIDKMIQNFNREHEDDVSDDEFFAQLDLLLDE